jgi:hypothetical protein
MNNINYYSKYKKYKRKYILLQNGGYDFNELLNKVDTYIVDIKKDIQNEFDKQFNLILKSKPNIKKFFDSIKPEQTEEEIFKNLKLNADAMKTLINKLLEEVLAKIPTAPGIVAKAAQKTANLGILGTFSTLLTIFYDKFIEQLKPTIMIIIDKYKKTHTNIKSAIETIHPHGTLHVATKTH